MYLFTCKSLNNEVFYEVYARDEEEAYIKIQALYPHSRDEFKVKLVSVVEVRPQFFPTDADFPK